MDIEYPPEAVKSAARRLLLYLKSYKIIRTAFAATKLRNAAALRAAMKAGCLPVR